MYFPLPKDHPPLPAPPTPKHRLRSNFALERALLLARYDHEGLPPGIYARLVEIERRILSLDAAIAREAQS